MASFSPEKNQKKLRELLAMHLKNEEETRKAIETWSEASPALQRTNLRQALESLELDQMHYEQKANAKGIARCETCLALLRKRLAELEIT
jgi:hypothetical protein